MPRLLWQDTGLFRLQFQVAEVNRRRGLARRFRVDLDLARGDMPLDAGLAHEELVLSRQHVWNLECAVSLGAQLVTEKERPERARTEFSKCRPAAFCAEA